MDPTPAVGPEVPPEAAEPGATTARPGAAGSGTERGAPAESDDAPATAEYQAEKPADTGEYAPAGPLVTGDYVPAEPRESSEPAPPAPKPAAVPETVAGYEIRGVLGRGAFGVVYKARQPGLKRIVALKMILAGGHADEHDLNRFRSEAEVVARLQHPHIVQIYEVGEDQGKPFFSLEFVDGTSLKEKIAGTPQPPRAAAELARTLALAMDHAHQHGIVHRDLKPANILMTQDGVPKIGDFGLARRLEEDSGQTRTGAAVGTPSYMAPEQAEGRSRDAGPLADVYSLGAILYELLTGRAPFRGSSVLETLQQVRTREPVAPTQFQPGVPRDLETICLKCLHKDPGRRYASAADLAEDLRCFLAGEPIVARPVSRTERLWRWCQRNPRVAWLTGLLLLGVLVYCVTLPVLLWNLSQARTDAVDKANLAEEKARIAREQTVRAELAATDAKKQSELAAKWMGDLVVTVNNRTRSPRLAEQGGPEVERLRRDLFDILQDRTNKMIKEMDLQGVSTFGEARTCQRTGDIMKRIGRGEEAMLNYKQAHDLIKKVVDAQPDYDVARANLGTILLSVADIRLTLTGDGRASLGYCRRARDLQQEIFTHPRSGEYTELDNKRILSHADFFLARSHLYLGDPAAARPFFEESLAYRELWSRGVPASREARSFVAEVHLWLGIVGWHLRDPKAVEEHFRAAQEICEDLIRLRPNAFDYQADLADIRGAYGDALLRLGKEAEAETSYRRSLETIRRVVDHDPDDIAQMPLLALAYERLGGLALRRHQKAEADADYGQACRLRERLHQIEPANRSWHASYLLALAHCGRRHEAADGAGKLRPQVGHSTELLLQVARCYAVCAALDTPQKPQYLDGALEALRTATQLDYRDAVVLETDPDLEVLRQQDAFRGVLRDVKAR